MYLNRFYSDHHGTTGMLYIDDKPFCFTVEKPWLDNQKSISCIPTGKYTVRFREDPTPLTMSYRKKYDFFSFHLEIVNVKNRSGIYIHVANTPKDVLGCVGVAETAGKIGSNFIGSSRKCFKKLYSKLKAELQKDLPLSITISKRA